MKEDLEDDLDNKNMNNICDDSDDYDDDDDDDDDDEFLDEASQFFPICCRDTNNVKNSFSTLIEALEYDQKKYKFDLLAMLPSSSDDDFFEISIIRINQLRAKVQQIQEDESALGPKLMSLSMDDTDESFFKPTLPDDAILMCLEDLADLKAKKEDIQVASGSTVEENEEDQDSSVPLLKMKLLALEKQLELAKSCITSLTMTNEKNITTTSTKETKGSSSKNGVDNDGYYFDSYSHHSIHETMLRDTVRTSAYERAIMNNADKLFKGKTVMDIGCGTGVLSIFAAKAGAKQVIAIDNSDMIEEAKKIVHANGYSDIITCMKGKMEDLIESKQISTTSSIDVIVSEWMGYALFFETMLPSVLVARDTLMNKESGTMYPNGASVYLEGASDDRLQYWDNVHGIDMSSMKKRVAHELCMDASVEIVSPQSIVTNRCQLMDYNLNTCMDKDLDMNVPFELSVQIDDEEKEEVTLDKLVVSFDIAFDFGNTTDNDNNNAVYFSTGCQSEATHWKQTSIWFDPSKQKIPTLKSKEEVFKGIFNMTRNATNPREMDIHVLWEIINTSTKDRRDHGYLTTKVSA